MTSVARSGPRRATARRRGPARPAGRPSCPARARRPTRSRRRRPDGRPHHPAVGVGRAAQVLERQQARTRRARRRRCPSATAARSCRETIDRDVDAERARGPPPGSGRPTRRGRRGSSVTMSPDPGPTFEASTPPFAHTKPCGVSVMSTPLLHAHDPARLAEHDLDLAGVAVPRARRTRPPRAAARSSAGRRRAPSALDTTFWVTTSTSSVAERQDARRSPRARRRSSPPRSSPVADLGQAGEGEDLDPAVGRQSPRRPRRPGGRRRRSASARSRSSGVSRSSASTLGRARRSAASADGGEPRVAGPAVPPNAGSMTSGGSSSRAFVPRPWRSGASTTLGLPAASPAASERVEGRGADTRAGRPAATSRRSRVDRARGPPGGRGSGRATAGATGRAPGGLGDAQRPPGRARPRRVVDAARSRAPRPRCAGAAARRGRGAPPGRAPRRGATSRPRRRAPG